MSARNEWKKMFTQKALGVCGITAAIMSGIGAGVLAQASPQPGFTPFDYFELDEASGIYELRDTEQPFLGDAERLGTFEIHKVTLKQVTSALFRTKVTDRGDLCKVDRSRLEELDQKTAERSCGVKVWAYGLNGQIFLFKADRQAVERGDALEALPFESTNWDRRISLSEAQSDLSGSHVMRAFSIPRTEINRRSELRTAAQRNHLYAFSGSAEPGEVVSTQAQAFAWNAAFVIFGASLNPMYVVQVPRNQNTVSSLKITQKESFSMLLMGNSTFTTEYHLRKAK